MRSRFLHGVFRSGLLFGFSYYILYLVRSDNILLYIAPRMVVYVKWSAVALYAVAVYQAYLAVVAVWTRKEPECSCGELPPFRLKALLIYSLFAFPLALGFAMPDATMGSALAAKKGMNLKSAESINDAAQTAGPTSSDTDAAPSEPDLNKLFPYDAYTESYAKLAKELYGKDRIQVADDLYLETISSVDLFLDSFIGKKIELSGFVYREENMEHNRIIIARFALQCCSADAAPWGILAEYDRASVFADDSWVKITGTIGKSRYNDLDILTVKAGKIEKIPTPKSAYVYPNPNF